MTPTEIARSLTEAQKEALLAARWIHPGGQEPMCLAPFTDVWPAGVATFFSLHTDRLTPLGLKVRAALERMNDEQ